MWKPQRIEASCLQKSKSISIIIFHCVPGRRDLREIFIQAEFDSDPEYVAFNSLGEEALGNITWVCMLIPLLST